MTSDRRHDLPFWFHSRYVVAAAAVLASISLVLAGGFLAFERAELQEAALDRAELFSRVLEDQANRTFNGVDLAMATAAETTRLHQERGDGASLSPQLQQALAAQPFLRSISLIDAKGEILASSNQANVGLRIERERLLPPRTAAGLGHLLPGRDLADLTAGTAGKSASTAFLMPMVKPMGEASDAPWLVAAINLDYFANQYDLLLGDAPVRAALLSFDGQLLAVSESMRAPIGSSQNRHRAFTDFLPNREKGRFAAPSINGDTAFTAFRTARRHPLVVMAETPESFVYDELLQIARSLAIGLAVVLLLIGSLATLAWRSLRSHEAVSDDLEAARGTMAAQHAFTDRLFQVSPIPLVVKDTQGRFVRVNKAWTDFTGQAPERLIGLNMGRLYPAHLAAPHEVQEQIAIASGAPVHYEEQMLDVDGLPRDVMIRVVPFTDAEGQVAGVIACLMDVTEFREAAMRTMEAKEAAERANAAKSEFLANISHELRTPLQAILGFSELGGLRSRQDARLNGMFVDIHSAGERMLSLVNNLLDLSRLESTVGEIQREVIDLSRPMLEVVHELTHLARSRQLSLSTPLAAIDGHLPVWVLADSFRMQQVLRNILANAIRFAPEGSTISLDWWVEEDREACITVRDHGPGIPEAELDSIFEAFVQSTRTKSGAGGTGLGLAICRKIVAAHHGTVRAYNHPEGGAVFEVRLPVVSRADLPAA